MVSVTMPFETETTLTVSDSWFTTQASSLPATPGLMLTDTGSIPTGISTSNFGLAGLPGAVRLNTDRVALGVFTANRRVPSAEIRTGLVCAPSKLTYAAGGTCAASGAAASRANSAPDRHDCVFLSFNMNPSSLHCVGWELS